MQETPQSDHGDSLIRNATIADIEQITEIYNQGILDRIATLEDGTKSIEEMVAWLNSRSERYKVIVAQNDKGSITGWASLNTFNDRECYKGVADLSIYIHREERGKGLGKTLLLALFETAKQADFYKIVLHTFSFNYAGQSLYTSLGFTTVGTYINQGRLDGKWIDMTIMEKMLIDI